MVTRRTVAIGFVGLRLDAGHGSKRWDRWRPSVCLAQQDDLLLDRFELLHQRSHQKLAMAVAKDIRQVSPETQVRPVAVDIENPWDLEEVYAALHDYCLDQRFRPQAEDYLVHITTGTHIEQICMFLLAESRLLPGRLVQTSPGRSMAAKAQGRVDVIDLDLSRYDRLASRFARQAAEGLSSLKAGIETRSEHFNALIARLERVATSCDDPLLLLGPTGSGKSALARRIYELRRLRGRVAGDFVDVNCATLRGDAAMSALFGHVKGAYTGATSARAGYLRAADGGVLFLDEVAELGLDEQAMVLRALEEKRYYPVGSDTPVESDFQLLAGTHRDLRQRVREGLFREDLLARIDVWAFELPALRERPEDLEPNLDHELAQVSRDRDLVIAMTREARRRYLDFAAGPEGRWPGNFRDLAASVRRMATLAEGGRVRTPDVEEELARLRSRWAGAPDADAPRVRARLGSAADDLDRFDRVQLEDVLAVLEEAASLSEAGRRLFAASRRRKKSVNDADRLRKYLARFELDGKALLSP